MAPPAVLLGFLVGGFVGFLLGMAIVNTLVPLINIMGMARHSSVTVAAWDRARELERFIEQHGLTPPPAGSAKS